jgi:CDP-diacylglycerol--glycerol-3-phosphate 3-phosphatidyltransferase
LPNAVTIARLTAGVILFILLLCHRQITVTHLFSFALIALTDFLDGYLARKFNARTPLGQLLDPLADKIVLLAAFGYFCYTNSVSTWFTILYFTREIIQTTIRIHAYTTNKQSQTPTFFISKLKTALSYLYCLLLFAEAINGWIPETCRSPMAHMIFEVIITILSFTGILKPYLKK